VDKDTFSPGSCLDIKLIRQSQPDYHPQKPIIVGLDDRLDSPETIALRYEEAARVADGGGPRGDSPPRILDMAAYGKAAPLPSMPGRMPCSLKGSKSTI
jgi:hypothetical protein